MYAKHCRRLDLASGHKNPGNKGPPYARLAKNQSRYIEAKYVPNGITLIEPRSLKQADGFNFLKHIATRQALHKPPDVFRFSRVGISRKTKEADRHRRAKYPDEQTEESSASETPLAPKKKRAQRKQNATRTAGALESPEQPSEANVNPMREVDPAATDAAGDSEKSNSSAARNIPSPKKKRAPRKKTATTKSGKVESLAEKHHIPTPTFSENITSTDGGSAAPRFVVTFGPNDPIPASPGIFHVPVHGQVIPDTLKQPDNLNNMVHAYPAGLPAQFTGVIDPALIALSSQPVTSPSPSPPMATTTHADMVLGIPVTPPPKPTPSSPITLENAERPSEKPKRKSIRPRPRGKAADIVRPDFGLITPTATVKPHQLPSEHPASSPIKAEGTRRSADRLAAEEASGLNIPAKRLRTPKVRKS